MFKKVATLLFSSLLVFSFVAIPVHAQTGVQDLQNNLTDFATKTGLGNKEDKDSLKTKIGNVINIILGFLGIIAVVFIMAGGFTWITAGGSSEKVEQAKSNITNAVIGLAIVLLSYAIVNFAIWQLRQATNTASKTQSTGTTTDGNTNK